MFVYYNFILLLNYIWLDFYLTSTYKQTIDAEEELCDIFITLSGCTRFTFSVVTTSRETFVGIAQTRSVDTYYDNNLHTNVAYGYYSARVSARTSRGNFVLLRYLSLRGEQCLKYRYFKYINLITLPVIYRQTLFICSSKYYFMCFFSNKLCKLHVLINFK